MTGVKAKRWEEGRSVENHLRKVQPSPHLSSTRVRVKVPEIVNKKQ